MRKKDSIKTLIHSLTMNEKRYFKMYNSFYEKDSSYSKLFDLIDKNKDEIEQLKITHIRVTKNRLQQRLLKSLRSFNSGKTPQLLLRELLDYIELLQQKNLYYQALTVISKAKSIAIKYEQFNSLIELLTAEQRIYITLKDLKVLETVFEKNCKAIVHYTNVFENLTRFAVLEGKLGVLILTVGRAQNIKSKKLYVDLFSNKLFSHESNALSKRAKIIFNYISGIYYLNCEGDYRKSLEYFLKIKTILDSDKNLYQLFSLRYILTIGNILSTIVYIPEVSFERAIKYLNFYKAIPPQTVMNQDEIEVRYYCTLTEIYLQYGKYKDIEQHIPDILKWLNNVKETDKIKFKLYQLYFNMASILFILEKYNKALTLFAKITNDQNLISKNIVCYSKLFSLLIYYETNCYDLINNMANSTIRLLKKLGGLNEMEKTLIRFLQKSATESNSNETKKKDFTLLKKELQSIINNNPIEAKSLEYIDFISWIDSKLQNQSLSSFLTAKVEKKRNLL
ncbi:MAG: hypothetical protein J0M08_02145 [Bacteroidetes bacterium]|nr:hypothetical protein [Bacteroidota bacterium]